ncbi:glucocorticoid-induced transcript 1 protein [Onychostoma macrolepis]|uniref:Glucocorticoid-induced transcript 1 protein n=1 Tax=Onychostoma macrolepis TaxID=369639 RepID=A0A7J6C6B9_9TELE|nr:glucocorticoid-induced transcript 1 protein [Onychostoma macrolepis]KAF4102780.1 hypothetical protein G5714_015663 [Onychostoma macrolepis]
MNTFSVLVLEFIIVSRAQIRTKCNNNSRFKPVSNSVPLRWSDQTRSASFSSSRHSRSPSSSLSSHAANMKQITKPTRIPSENHFITAGRARSASRQPPSLDKLPEQYLTGQWPREPYQPQASCMSDKATQTPGSWTEDEGEVNVHKRSASWGSADHLIEIAKLRQQLQRSLQGSRSIKEKEEMTQLNPAQPKRLSASSSNMVLSRPVLCRMPSYSDCVNQELENVFICEDWGREEEKALEVRDGGRAPVPPLHHTHSTETQISCSPCYCCSPAADAEKDYRCGSPLPQFSSSPKPNNSYTFKREPPEGCEKVKVFEDLITCRTQGFPIFSCPDRNKVNFTPSGSAFCPVKLLCSSLFPSDDAARPSSGQTSGSFTELRPVSSERCSIRKCLLLS